MDAKLGEELLNFIFSKEGLLGQANPDYEERSGQKAMAEQVFKAYLDDEIALTEAGTGIGKSLAYLASAMLWASRKGERTVISTYTIALQHQLIEKEIPFLQSALDLDISAVLVKGMQNYLCLRKLEEAEERFDLFSEDEKRKEYDRLKIWSEETSSGCRTSLPFYISGQSWDRFSADGDSCTGSRCPHFRDCHFFKARRQAEDAQLLIVNHYLLLTDLNDKAEGGKARERTILPSYKRLILDEAHHLEEVALDVFSERCDWIGIIRLINRFLMHREDPEGRIQLLEKALKKSGQSTHALLIDLPAQRIEILRKLERSFLLLKTFLEQQQQKRSETRCRMQPSWAQSTFWNEEVVPAFFEVSDLILKWITSWQNLCANAREEETVFTEVLNLAARLQKQAEFLRHFFSMEEAFDKRVRWIEKEEEKSIHLIEVELDIAEKMESIIFSPMQSSALCSATLCGSRDFSFVRKRLGLQEREKISEAVHSSPFDFANRTLFMTVDDLPEPTAIDFTKHATNAIEELLKASGGGAFVLFTSNEMLRETYNALSLRDELRDFTLLRQGELGRHALIERFQETPRAVLFGVDSYWEGVDVPGDALRLVIIAKLPFHALQDPLAEALQEEIRAEGGNPFNDYTLPKAVVKFKQGFGRLMRHKQDRGIVVCLDKRIVTKNYGKRFLDALPQCPKRNAPTKEVAQDIENFLRK